MSRPNATSLHRKITDEHGRPLPAYRRHVGVEVRCQCKQRHLVFWAMQTPHGVLVALRAGKPILAGDDTWMATWWTGEDAGWGVICQRGRAMQIDARWLRDNLRAGTVDAASLPDPRGQIREGGYGPESL